VQSVIVVAALVVLLAGPARAAGYADAGKDVAVQWCASCHAIDGGASAQDAAPPFRTIAGRSNVSADALRAFLFEPHGEMPKLEIPTGHIEDLVSYILSLKAE
jgi:mono/diheme cytochrome c family protein